jgi:UDP-N-acetylmuramoyl-tripeptide--D-alanyl-D-alanine ligase
MTLGEVARVVGGTVDPGSPASPEASPATVTGPAFLDSRRVEPGGLFVAFAGEHVDGHDFAAGAVRDGAAAVLASRPVGVAAVLVPDVQEALGRLARHVLARLREAEDPLRVVAITGSQGKTTTKDVLAAVLAAAGPTVATHGSFNNEIGLPLTVLRADAGTRFLVLEMGARGAGHLRALCAVAPPDVSLVLNVGKAHVGEFGSQDAIASAKCELVEALGPDGVAVLNADDPRVAAMAGRSRGRVLRFGTGADADVRLTEVRLDSGGRPGFRLGHGGEQVAVQLRLVGAHQALNAAAAAATAVACGLSIRDAAATLADVASLSRWRMEVSERPDGVTVVNDAYNANPDSMAAALASLVALGDGRRGAGPARTLAVLGEMRELGASSDAEHEAVGRLAVSLGVDQLVVVGAPARPTYDGARAERQLPGRAGGKEPVHVTDLDAATAWLAEHLRPGDVVLVKASRGARLDRVAEALLTAPDTARGSGAP